MIDQRMAVGPQALSREEEDEKRRSDAQSLLLYSVHFGYTKLAIKCIGNPKWKTECPGFDR